MKAILLILLVSLTSCNKADPETKEFTLASTNFPVKWLVDYISGESLSNLYIIPENIDPAYWQPTDSDLKKLNDCDLVFLNGATYEKWINTVSLTNTFDTSATMKKNFLTIKNIMEHEHNGKAHSHDGIDFNIWLNFDIFIKQAEEVEQKLSNIIKNPEVNFKGNLKSLIAELEEIKKQIHEVTKNNKKFLASHSVYDYMATQYGLDIQSFHWDPNKIPSEEEWLKLKNSKQHSSYMLWEDSPSLEIQTKLDELGISVIVFRTCGNTPPSKDFIKEMKKNIKNLNRALNK